MPRELVRPMALPTVTGVRPGATPPDVLVRRELPPELPRKIWLR